MESKLAVVGATVPDPEAAGVGELVSDGADEQLASKATTPKVANMR